MIDIAILVLAAGKSTRMKTIKQLLKINNKYLLEGTLDKVKTIEKTKVFCVIGAHKDIIKETINFKDVAIIENLNFGSGISSSIVAGIHQIKKEEKKFEAVLILLADQPDVNIEYLNELISIFNKNKDKIIASNYFKKAGVPAIFPKKYFDKLLLLKGDKGAKYILQNFASETIILNKKQSFKDIDTPEDYLSYIESI